MDEGRLIPITIRGQRYPIRSSLEPDYVVRLASYVDEKIRAASETAPGGDSHRLAVVAALNIADELFRCREANRDRTDELKLAKLALSQLNQSRDSRFIERAEEIERLLDRVLMA